MSSIVLELQQDALNDGLRVSTLLRKALVVAKKLDITDFESWITSELNGYPEGIKIPQYRMIYGQVKGFNSVQGDWIPIIFPTRELSDSTSRVPNSQPNSELENIVLHYEKSGVIQRQFPGDIETHIRKAIRFNVPISYIVPLSSVVGVLDAVRNIILNWSLKLEKDGILGEGLSFSAEEKDIATKQNYFVNNFMGEVGSMLIQQATDRSIQVTMISKISTKELESFVRNLEDTISKIKLDETILNELKSDINTLTAQIKSSNPKQTIIRESLLSLRGIIEAASGSAAAQLLVKQLTDLLS